MQRALFAIGQGRPACALLYIDLDQFKLINDTSGHLAGDQLLSQLALVMAEQLRAGDMLARLGGDEFGILAHDAGSTTARRRWPSACARASRATSMSGSSAPTRSAPASAWCCSTARG